MKKTILLILAVALMLTGCSTVSHNVAPSDPELISAGDLLSVLLAAVPEGAAEPQTASSDDYALHLAVYGIDPALVRDCAIAYTGGAQAFELAVIDLQTRSSASESALLSYLQQRQGDFTGYAPDQAAIAAQGKVFAVENDHRLILAITEATSAISGALSTVGYTSVTEISEARTRPGQTDISDDPPSSNAATVPTPPDDTDTGFTPPQDWFKFTAPNIDDMSLYDTAALLSAWQTSSPKGLSGKDRQTYMCCAEIIGETVTDNMTDYEKERAIYQWLIQNPTYDWRHQDPLATTPRDSYCPYGALVNGKAVCLGFATSFQLLMDMLNIECITVVGAAFRSTEDHAWNMVKLEGEWYCVDVTWDLGKNIAFCDYFNVTSDYMAKTDHQWDYANTPIATATDGGH